MPAASVKEYTFTWEGTDRKGMRVKGESIGPSDSVIRLSLRKQGINPLRVNRKTVLFSGNKKIKGQDIAAFSRQLATMMGAGVPLVQALEIVGRGNPNPSMSRMILDIRVNVQAGNSLAESLARHPRYFDELYVNLVNAGERSGALETLLEKIATYKEKTEAIKKKVKKALTYPAAVIVVAIIVTTILLYFVVPQFASLFQSFGGNLPAFTQMVVNLSNFVRDEWWVIGGIAIAAVVAFIQAHRRSLEFRRAIDRMMIKAPIVGDILYKSAVARFARTLATMFTAGVPLVEALESVAKAAGNIVFTEGILNMRNKVATGQQLQLAMQQSGIFPAMATQMVGIGEDAGALDTMCSKVADFYEEEVDIKVDNLSTLLEPLIMVILGILVGGLVVAMYLPIFNLGKAI
ncbi:MAG: type II secretion system F family protein [Nevskiaceae bacterium]|nr:MAG: type II secretion system F family protein [Nevskiaceae bacterium]TBR71828.1 MAG: type II secretion system F family protein [Nevskiaceae bacterium]